MAKLDKKYEYSLREVKLAEVAAYLQCDPRRLAIALQRLAADPTAIACDPLRGAGVVMILPGNGTHRKAYPKEARGREWCLEMKPGVEKWLN